jgi:hypothetical protein
MTFRTVVIQAAPSVDFSYRCACNCGAHTLGGCVRGGSVRVLLALRVDGLQQHLLLRGANLPRPSRIVWVNDWGELERQQPNYCSADSYNELVTVDSVGVRQRDHRGLSCRALRVVQSHR